MKIPSIFQPKFLTALVVIFLLSAVWIQAQEKPDTETTGIETTMKEAPADAAEKETLWIFIKKGGSTMFGLAIISTIILAFAMERIIFFRKQKIQIKGVHAGILKALDEGGLEKVNSFLETKDLLISRVLLAGLHYRSEGKERVEKAIETAASIELGKLEKGLNLLNNLGNLAPLIGFFGTVTGMRHSFLQFVEKAAPTAKDLAGGVEEALITTIVGLFIAIPAYLLYNLFIYYIDDVTIEIEKSANTITGSMD